VPPVAEQTSGGSTCVGWLLNLLHRQLPLLTDTVTAGKVVAFAVFDCGEMLGVGALS